MNKHSLSALLALQAILLFSCNQQPDNTAQIKGLEDRIRQLEDQEKQLQLQSEQDKLAADRAAFEAEKQKFQDQQNGTAQPTPGSKPSSSDVVRSQKSGPMESDASMPDDSQTDLYRTDSYNVFYERLQSEGQWFNDETYGYVWQPSEAQRDESWRPYTDGHWAYTDRGWTWVSNENYGWATYHYGRWAKVRNVGWIWVPGNTWAPAWVSWRETENSDYVGWAPLPPECETSPSVKVEGWVDNYYGIGPAAYIFLKAVDLVRPTYRQAILPPQQSLTIINQTRNVTNITYNNNVVNNYGPQYQRLAQITNNRLERYQINYQQQAQPNANFRTLVTGNQVQVVAPPPQLERRATIAPSDVRQLKNAQVDRGWQNIDPTKAQQLKQAFQQNAPPVPKALPPQPPPPPKPVIAAVGSPAPNRPGQLPQKPGALRNSQLSAERQRIEAEKAQLEQQKQALLNGGTPPAPAQTPQGKPGSPGQLAEKPQGSPGASNHKPVAPDERAGQVEAQKAQQAEQARPQQETQQKQQAAQQQAAQQQQQATAEKARQAEAQKAQQAEQTRLQLEAQQKQQAAQQQAARQQQQAVAEKTRQAEAQKAQQAEQARLQLEAQQRQQAAQQQEQAAAERAQQAEAQRVQQLEQARAQLEAQRKQPAAEQQQGGGEGANRAEAQRAKKEEQKKKNVPPPPVQQQ
ncbi:MAG TPA: DUF6600 domain-containing protein [Chthoniobacterales bacterium]|nr:DUF6600 domain-containing protein [Chthoniobacterales bacterium]